MYRVGIDIGSTTIKCVVINEDDKVLYKDYKRHKSSITASLITLLQGIQKEFNGNNMFFNFTGSAGMLLATDLKVAFTQEVISATKAIRKQDRDIDVCIELGGEDAKIIFFDGNNVEQRMNGTCAGGTGAFIDQMATLLDVTSPELNELAKDYEKIYPIASRCGVFAKSDIQPLLNQGANHNDIAISIYQAIVNQTVAGLSQGRKIRGNVAFLGGPLTFASELRNRFIDFLNLENVFVPKDGEVFVAYGASLCADETILTIEELIERVVTYNNNPHRKVKKTLKALFNSQNEFDEFIKRHDQDKVEEIDINSYHGNAYLGVDAGSTTTKLVLLSETNEILYYYYSSNKGNPVDIVKKALKEMYSLLHDGIIIKGSFSTGYGEELIKHAFNLDGSEVETICHCKAASYFNKDVDFIIDIGGQDMKCFKVENDVISSIILNEACSSGCGSFLETFSTSLGYDIKDFAEMALDAKNPVDLGSRCTVFMNSGVKQAQAEAASTTDISAGLAYSVVKNALYKVIRTVDVKRDLGENIIVQGGTFYNNAVLRAFENEIGMNVVRPNIAGLMGAFGAALLAKEQHLESSSTLNEEGLEKFTYTTKKAVCKKCSNYCSLTINQFNNKKYISGNRCEKGAGSTENKDDIPNLYLYKYDKILSYQSDKSKDYKVKVGIPLVLNMYENIPFWFTFFDEFGFEVVYSDRSNKTIYELGQDSIPSDTACYPAKIVHGHIENLISKDVDIIFYPNMPFNFIEKDYRDNEFNCPIVAFYPEVIAANMENLVLDKFLQPYLSLNRKKYFIKNLVESFGSGKKLNLFKAGKAYDKAMDAYVNYRQDVLNEGRRALDYAKEHKNRVILLAGRPYHIDPEINHGIPKLLRSLDVVVISEDSVNTFADQDFVKVLNQWTYHTRLYDSAKYITTIPNANLIQLISFGCGLDAITSDEVKEIIEKSGKIYTGIKIDEVNNLGTANIRIRSLLSTMKEVD
ncbi:R-phenyllactate dehydratase activator [Candidatus Izimaplasma bacterium HR1]|jgi:predicted CoA-substrate-specific enzyme activase|uniref:acyl-CoA dehydratase activase-related protein n=1 Tax=Candidatus Izimoplasma sp. HR1 TaxID=1541959 RepID=UPI0004F63AB8|nr:R-phenyllactate dehydratase activator [Candidatus Izimaplasma bacterium HR1]